MRDAWRDRQQILANLHAALTLANDLEMGTLGYLIERAIDEAQAAQFVSLSPRKPPPPSDVSRRRADRRPARAAPRQQAHIVDVGTRRLRCDRQQWARPRSHLQGKSWRSAGISLDVDHYRRSGDAGPPIEWVLCHEETGEGRVCQDVAREVGAHSTIRPPLGRPQSFHRTWPFSRRSCG
jgi:hypothetical protein